MPATFVARVGITTGCAAGRVVVDASGRFLSLQMLPRMFPVVGRMIDIDFDVAAVAGMTVGGVESRRAALHGDRCKNQCADRDNSFHDCCF